MFITSVLPGSPAAKADGVPAFIGNTVELKEGPITPQPPAVTSKKLADNVTYIRLPGFSEGAADQVIAKLRDKPKAVLLDLRGNGGGSPREVTRLLGAPSEAYLLDDGSAVLLPKVRHLGPAREIIDTIGVPVDHYAPITALDLATGRDPGVAKALALV
ncbi:S41 family peptidase (plasmid) [Actinomadura sp. ATCC 31491]|uniref:S41 family peptidase n=1 Tax=Actinomadura luzonensis TaxID=2805427 RepID=A0ABT0GBU2_9ACTN|nr:S41 family peptidase [Actinomadura luzonensis]MCK2222062.1 S41 family peptidase [Actinomadura luzonensis]